ncbi:MAG: glycosyltransferase [Pseudanabaena sp. M57BS1SP1A06MG]|nr:glycosyltransferase [Pseudanabaena sp. M57BS1SP1A06MG]
MNSLYLSLCMIVKNESASLARCLDSVHSIVDEIIVVDTGSVDNTKEIALSYNAKIYDYEWNDDFASARNYANNQANGEWILSLDADEELVLNGDIRDYLYLQKDIILCTTLYRYNISLNSNKLIQEAYFFRIFRRDQKLHFCGRLHEQLFYENRPLSTQEIAYFGEDKGFIKHYGYSDGKSLKKSREFYIPMLERIANQEPLSWMLMYSLSGYYKEIGEFEKSLKCLEQVIERLMPNIITGEKPKDFIWVPIWLFIICEHYAQSKDLDNLLIILARSLQWCDKFPPIHNLAGKLFLELEFYLAAIAHFQVSIDCYMSNNYISLATFENWSIPFEFYASEALYFQGCCYIQLKNFDKAIELFEKCLSMSSNLSDAREEIFLDAKKKILWINNIQDEVSI